MRLVIDLQGAQGNSRGRGIGRFSQELALAMVRASGPHEPIILLNDALADTADILRDLFAPLLPRENIQVWHGLTGCSYLHGSLARRQASEMIRAQVIAGIGADLVHVASVIEGAGDDTVAAWPTTHCRVPTVATFYDAIPLLMPQAYLTDDARTAFYLRHLHDMKQCTALLGISESSRREAIAHLGFDAAYAFNILAGFDFGMFRPMDIAAEARDALLGRYGLRDGFVLFVGAGDPRKNDAGLVQAYANLPAALQDRHQLVIVGSWNPPLLREVASRHGVRAKNLVLLEHVPDADLPALYTLCRCFVMPSKHEGFGLPALEAAACGTAVIAGDNTSLPEVVGLADALFDANRPEDMAAKLHLVLTDDAFHTMLVAHGLAHSRQFTWTDSARRAWTALETVLANHPDCVNQRAPIGGVAARKQSLAFVGPLPPDASGIADYARDLLPALAAYYDITLVSISGVVDDPLLTAIFPVLTESAFAAMAGKFDRIVYQLGNAEFHIDILNTLMPRYPGVAVLHDAFIFNIPLVAFMRDGNRDALARTLFASHGWPAVMQLAQAKEAKAAALFPCAAPVFRDALGVLQHSAHARDIVARYVGQAAADTVRLVPFARAAWPRAGRAASRLALGMSPDAPVTCSFGIVAPTKRPLDVLAAWHAAFATDRSAVLAFVGDAGQALTAELRRLAAQYGMSNRLILTGRVDTETYRHWLDAADIAVQLRTDSRGETSAAIADCMAVGLPVVANAHGAAAELPPDTLTLLPDAASTAALGAAIAALWADRPRRLAIAQAATAYVQTDLSPMAAARAYRDAIEHFYASGNAARSRLAMPALPDTDIAEAARALASNFRPPAPARLLLDASNMAQQDLGTGIQRVIREISQRVLASPDPSCLADMLRLDGTTLRHARKFAARLLDVSSHGLPDLPVLAGAGDTIVLMDNYGNITPDDIAALQRQRRQGARVVVVIYDLLPLQRPDWFPPDAIPLLQRWLRESLGLADAALCISRIVAEELLTWLGQDDALPARALPLDIGWFHLGADFRAAVAATGEDEAGEAALRSARQRPTLLMVGTIEPRKGHAEAVAAFDHVWASGEDIGLTIVGKAGWSTELLQTRLNRHPELGRRLHWLQHPGDSRLAQLYAAHSGLLAASEGEGFGLPIIEAARAGLPVLARDIPVFREVAGDHAVWFGKQSGTLAESLRVWGERARTGTLPSAEGITCLNWDQSTQAFLRQIRSADWPMTWTPASWARPP